MDRKFNRKSKSEENSVLNCVKNSPDSGNGDKRQLRSYTKHSNVNRSDTKVTTKKPPSLQSETPKTSKSDFKYERPETRFRSLCHRASGSTKVIKDKREKSSTFTKTETASFNTNSETASSNTKSDTTSSNTKSETTSSNTKFETTSSNTKSETTSSNTTSKVASSNTKIHPLPISLQPNDFQDSGTSCEFFLRRKRLRSELDKDGLWDGLPTVLRYPKNASKASNVITIKLECNANKLPENSSVQNKQSEDPTVSDNSKGFSSVTQSFADKAISPVKDTLFNESESKNVKRVKSKSEIIDDIPKSIPPKGSVTDPSRKAFNTELTKLPMVNPRFLEPNNSISLNRHNINSVEDGNDEHCKPTNLFATESLSADHLCTKEAKPKGKHVSDAVEHSDNNPKLKSELLEQHKQSIVSNDGNQTHSLRVISCKSCTSNCNCKLKTDSISSPKLSQATSNASDQSNFTFLGSENTTLIHWTVSNNTQKHTAFTSSPNNNTPSVPVPKNEFSSISCLPKSTYSAHESSLITSSTVLSDANDTTSSLLTLHPRSCMDLQINRSTVDGDTALSYLPESTCSTPGNTLMTSKVLSDTNDTSLLTLYPRSSMDLRLNMSTMDEETAPSYLPESTCSTPGNTLMSDTNDASLLQLHPRSSMDLRLNMSKMNEDTALSYLPESTCLTPGNSLMTSTVMSDANDASLLTLHPRNGMGLQLNKSTMDRETALSYQPESTCSTPVNNLMAPSTVLSDDRGASLLTLHQKSSMDLHLNMSTMDGQTVGECSALSYLPESVYSPKYDSISSFLSDGIVDTSSDYPNNSADTTQYNNFNIKMSEKDCNLNDHKFNRSSDVLFKQISDMIGGINPFVTEYGNDSSNLSTTNKETNRKAFTSTASSSKEETNSIIKNVSDLSNDNSQMNVIKPEVTVDIITQKTDSSVNVTNGSKQTKSRKSKTPRSKLSSKKKLATTTLKQNVSKLKTCAASQSRKSSSKKTKSNKSTENSGKLQKTHKKEKHVKTKVNNKAKVNHKQNAKAVLANTPICKNNKNCNIKRSKATKDNSNVSEISGFNGKFKKHQCKKDTNKTPLKQYEHQQEQISPSENTVVPNTPTVNIETEAKEDVKATQQNREEPETDSLCLESIPSDEVLLQHAKTLWCSENRRTFQKSLQNCADDEIDTALNQEWQLISPKIRTRYYTRARFALLDEDKHSMKKTKKSAKMVKKEEEPDDFNEALRRTAPPIRSMSDIDKFLRLRPTKQRDILKKWLKFYQKMLPRRDYSQFMTDFEETVYRNHLNTTEESSPNGTDMDCFHRRILFECVKRIKPTIINHCNEKFQLRMEELQIQYSDVIWDLIGGNHSNLISGCRSKRLEQTLKDLVHLEEHGQLDVKGHPRQTNSYTCILNDIGANIVKTADNLFTDLPEIANQDLNDQLLNSIDVTKELPVLTFKDLQHLDSEINQLWPISPDVAYIPTETKSPPREKYNESIEMKIREVLHQEAVEAFFRSTESSTKSCCDLDSPSCILSTWIAADFNSSPNIDY